MNFCGHIFSNRCECTLAMFSEIAENIWFVFVIISEGVFNLTVANILDSCFILVGI